MNRSTRRLAGSATATVVLISGLAACSAVDSGTTSTTRAKTIKSATFVNPLPDYPAWKVIGECMQTEAKKQGIKFTQSGQTGSAVDTKYMIERFQQAIAIKTDAIITFPVSAEQFDPLFKRAKSAGVYTASVEGGQTKNNDINAGTSFEEFGKLAAESVSKKGGHQYVGFITQGPTGPDATFVNAFKSWTKENPDGNVTVVDVRYDSGDPTKTPDLATAMLTAHPNLNHFVTNEGAATSPIISVIKQKKLKGKVWLTTNSKFSGSVEGLEAGYVYSFLVQDMCDIGTKAISGLVKYASGDHSTKDIATRIDFANAENYKALLADGKFQ